MDSPVSPSVQYIKTAYFTVKGKVRLVYLSFEHVLDVSPERKRQGYLQNEFNLYAGVASQATLLTSEISFCHVTENLSVVLKSANFCTKYLLRTCIILSLASKSAHRRQQL